MKPLELEVFSKQNLQAEALRYERYYRNAQLMAFYESWEPDYYFSRETLRLHIMVRELVLRAKVHETDQQQLDALKLEHAKLKKDKSIQLWLSTVAIFIVGLGPVFFERLC